MLRGLPGWDQQGCLWEAAVFMFRLAGEGRPEMCSPFLLILSLPLSLPGVFRGGHDLLVRSRLVLTDTVTMQVTARSVEELPVDVVMASVG